MALSKFYRNLVTKKQRARVYDEFFADAAVHVDWNQVGLSQTLIEDGDGVLVSLSPWAGPVADISNLVHEMAHFVEIDEARMTRFGWGLDVPQVHIGGQSCDQPVTCQATKRELRVMAYQASVLKYLGFPKSIRNLVQPLVFMSDWTLVPLENGIHPYADGAPKVPYDEIDKSRRRWCAKQIETFSETHTLERFLSEWKRRNEVLKQREAA